MYVCMYVCIVFSFVFLKASGLSPYAHHFQNEPMHEKNQQFA